MGVKSPKLLFLGLVRFGVVVLITIAAAGIILYYHADLMKLIWEKPASQWVVWLWFLVSWLMALVLVGISVVISYLAAQVLFAVFIMDLMSRITESMVLGTPQDASGASFWATFFFLVKQEIPRALLPVMVMMVLTIISWLTPAGPVVTILTSLITCMFLAWDNTDLVPARKLTPFRQRFGFLTRSLPFHLGFGLLFLVPVFNVLSLSFAPVGATLYFLEAQDVSPEQQENRKKSFHAIEENN